jgi:hypothetical protein
VRASTTGPGRRHPLVAVRARTVLAIDDLAGIRSGDPAAAHAVQAARLTAHTLRSCWIPSLDAALANRPDPSSAA